MAKPLGLAISIPPAARSAAGGLFAGGFGGADLLLLAARLGELADAPALARITDGQRLFLAVRAFDDVARILLAVRRLAFRLKGDRGGFGCECADGNAEAGGGDSSFEHGFHY